MSATLTAAELARRVRRRGMRIDEQTAAMFVAFWVPLGIARETTPGRFELTEHGWTVARGLLAADPDEVAA